VLRRVFVLRTRFQFIATGILTGFSSSMWSMCRPAVTKLMYLRLIGFAILASSALGLSSCADKAFRYYSDTQYPAKEREEVEILWSKPDKPFTVIADFQARRISIFETRRGAAKYMQSKAAEIGADAVIVGAYGGWRARSDKWASEDSHATSFDRYTGTAIRYRSNVP